MFQYLRNLITRTAPTPQIDISKYFRDITPSSAGISVNRTSAFGIPSFYKGCSLISGAVANCAKHIYEIQPDGGRRKCIEHPAYRLIYQQANPLVTSWCFFRSLVISSLYAGNGYAYIDRNQLYEPQGLYLLDPNNTAPVIVNGLGMMPQLYYSTLVDGKTINIQAADIIHVKNVGNDTGIVGLSVIDTLREVLGLGLATIKYGAVYFRNGGATGATVIEYPTQFKTQEAKDTFRQSFEALHSGIDGSNRVVILEAGATLAKNSVANDASQLVESRAFTAVDIANCMNLPAHKLNSQVNSSYGSIGAENLATLSDCYENWLQNIESELESKLLTEKEKQSGQYYIEFDRSKLMAVEPQVAATVAIQLYQAGLKSFEEYRQEQNLSVLKDKSQTWYEAPQSFGSFGNKEQAQDG